MQRTLVIGVFAHTVFIQLLLGQAENPASTPIANSESFVVVGSDKPASPFGIGSCHVNGRSVDDFKRWMPAMQGINIRIHRTPGCDWGTLEPKPGEWDWRGLDERMKYLDDHQFAYGLLVWGNPGWNKSDKPGYMPVNNLAGWSNYISKLCEHVRGKARHLEVWNEPPNFVGPDQTPADYAKLVAATYIAAKKVDPAFKVGLAAKSVHVNYLDQVIRAGAKDHFDYIVLHPYEVLDGVANNHGREAVYMNIVPVVRRMLAAQNPAKVNVPIIFTELGIDASKGEQVQADGLIKAYTMGIAQGVANIQWFEGRDGDSGPMGLLDGSGKPRPAYHSLGNLIKHLGHQPTYLGWTKPADNLLAFAFDGSKGKLLVMWTPTMSPVPEFDFKQAVTMLNPSTGKTIESRHGDIGVSPVLILNPPDSLVKQAEQNRNRPLLWDGDFYAAREVSIEFGDQTVTRGLHSAAGADLAKAVLAYGGPARSGGVPGGNVFTVNPEFLSYDSVPIEITVVVRRNPENVNAGFKLVYESREGFKTAGGWYTIPDNKTWHTMSWRIDDPQFVNYWGFNFVLESDGNTYNKYLIKSVNVKKL